MPPFAGCPVTAPAIRHVALNTDFQWRGQADIKHRVFDDSGDAVAVCLPFRADVSAPAIVPVVAVVAWWRGNEMRYWFMLLSTPLSSR